MFKFDAGEGQHYIALTLRYGSLISTLVMALGLCVLLVHAAALFYLPGAAAGEFWVKSVRAAALALFRSDIARIDA